ncbi:MAG: hypothetical protein KAQ71_07940 [Desulfobulbaceae bacterium]|nr:hypothetical protein [Desulfobulbaceae bacterium]
MKKVYMILCATALVVGLGMSPAYAGQPEDSERTCTDGKDNDRNGLTDCEEATCAPFCGGGCTVTEDPEVSCSDGVDNDCDGDIDDADSDCGPVCTPTEDPEVSCSDGVDNDCDGDIDDADTDCQTACVPIEDHDCLTAADYPTACLGCHDSGVAGDQYGDAFGSVHYQWTGPGTDMTNQPGTVQGKLTNAMNTYCINVLGNWGVCGTCHAGRGVKPGAGDDVSNVDCLMCHNEEYALARTRLGDGSMGPATPADSMYQPATPTRTNCLKCHAFGGGGNGIKRGDLANELISNTDPEYDVHMNNAGANLQCFDCHSFNGMHKVTGKGSDLRPTDFDSEVSCESCHNNDGNGGWSHEIAGVRGEPDRHMDKVSCQACHIPTYGKTHTEIHRTWTTHINGTDATTCDAANPCPGHPDHDSNTEPLVPAYKFWNRMSDNYLLGDVANISETGTYQTSMPQGDTGEYNGKLYPFKYKTSEAPISTDGKIIAVDTWEYLKVTGNINTAVAQGVDNMRAAGITVGDFDHWGTSDTYQLITHGITPAASITGCDQCHGAWDIASDNMLDAMGYKLKGAKFDVCNQCHDGGKKLPRNHERMHGHVNKGSGIDCLFCHDFTRATSRGLCSPCDPACVSEFVDTVPYPHVCN